LSIKQYTLSEVGSFYKTIVQQEKEKKVENLITNWMSTHYEHKALMDTVKDLTTTKNKKNKKDNRSTTEIKSEWERLANFMQRKK
jgi:hypothetical protein